MSENRSNAPASCLLVSCHPLEDSLCAHLTGRIARTFAERGVGVDHLDLYRSDLSPVLSAEERVGYFTGPIDEGPLRTEIAQLRAAETLVLVFPTWWFGLPALMKGWFDRVWAPGVAFDHPAEPGGRITPKLTGMKHCLGGHHAGLALVGRPADGPRAAAPAS